jgi:drug/metabolite transporter (DMT)-like permease
MSQHANNSSDSTRQTTTAWLILAGLVVTWGSSFILIKKALVYSDPIEVGALRVGITFLFLLPFAIPHLKKITRKDFFWPSISGFAGNLFPNLLITATQRDIDSAIAGLLNSLTPLFMLLVGLIRGEMLLINKKRTVAQVQISANK